jgi:phage regulator Rha-like protein
MKYSERVYTYKNEFVSVFDRLKKHTSNHRENLENYY